MTILLCETPNVLFLILKDKEGLLKKLPIVSLMIRFFKRGQRFNKVKFADVLYLESEHVYVKVHTASHSYLVRSSLQEYLEHFDSNHFFRIHRSDAINLEQIQSISAEYVIINSIALPVSKTFREQLFSRFKLS